jgi:hypothetical protein
VKPNYFNGVRKERVFENAFLEYGCMESMTAPTHRRVYFLTDPIEDRARDWADYKVNYQATFLAEILYPNNNYYEVMPWPDRIYEGLYQKSATDKTMEHIPRFYSTQMQVMINTLNNMPLSDNKVSGSTGVGVLMANSLMFQRGSTEGGRLRRSAAVKLLWNGTAVAEAGVSRYISCTWRMYLIRRHGRIRRFS